MTTVVPTVGRNRETNPEAEVILEAQDLKKYFPVTKGLLVSKVTDGSRRWMAYPSDSAPERPWVSSVNRVAARAPLPRCC